MKMLKLIPLLLAGSALAVAGGQSQSQQICCSIPVEVKAFVGTMGMIQNTVGVHAQECVNEGGPNDVMLFHIGAKEGTLEFDSNNVTTFAANGAPSHRGVVNGTIGSWQTVTWLPPVPTAINFPVSNSQGTIVPEVWSPSGGQADQNGNFTLYVGAAYAVPGSCTGPGTAQIHLTLMQK